MLQDVHSAINNHPKDQVSHQYPRSRDRLRCNLSLIVPAFILLIPFSTGCEEDQGSVIRHDSIVDLSLDLEVSSDPTEIDFDYTNQEDMGAVQLDAMPLGRDELDPPGVEPDETTPLKLQELTAVNFQAFTTSTACALCHSNHNAATAMRNTEGEEIAPFNLWRGSMMANASRDPFWWAQVSSEVALSDPADQEEIEGECIRCHAPALSETAREAANREGAMQDLKGSAHPAKVGLDGVACSVCHQILPDGLGTPETFSGQFKINSERKIFGPHRNPAIGPMVNHVNYTPTYAEHMTESKLCASCHTLIHEEAVDGEEEAWSFPEQTPYLEWRNSIYSNEDVSENSEARTCQDCHQPTYDDAGYLRTRIARSPPGGDFRINTREPFGQHLFVGGNAVLPQILKAERATLKPQAPDQSFDQITELAIDQLQHSAELTITDLQRDSEQLSFDVLVHSFVGHKLPTGFPSRRVWLVVKATKTDGEVIFYSGRYNPEGRIIGSDDLPLPSEWAFGPVEPHYDLIESSDQVQIYEAVMGDEGGRFTHAITQAKGWLKDNRLLPKGYHLAHPDAGLTMPIGLDDDENFIGGEDRVRYRFPVPADAGRVQLQVRLVYQTLGARFMRALFQVDTAEVAAFRTMYQRADVSPVVMATLEEQVP